MRNILSNTSLASLVVRLGVLSALTVSIALTTLGYVAVRNAVQESALEKLSFSVDRHSRNLTSSFREMQLNARFLATTPDVYDAARLIDANGAVSPDPSSKAEQARHRLEQTLASFLAERPEYTQARLIGAGPNAPELARVNNKGGRIEIVPPEELQDKGQEPYMRAARSLWPGGWHLSDVTLNRENGRVEPGSRPTIRGVFAISDDWGDVGGYIVLNADYPALVHRAIEYVENGVELHITIDQGHLMAISADRLRPDLIFNDEIEDPESHATAHLAVAPHHETPGMHEQDGFIHIARETRLDGGRTITVDVQIEKSVLLAEANKKLMVIGAVAAVLVGLITLAGLLIGRWLARPLTRLAHDVNQPRSPLEPLRLKVDGYQEIRLLADAFEQVSEDLAREGRNAETIFNSAAEGILLTDEHGTILRANPAALRIFETEEAAILGKNVTALMPERFRSNHGRHFASLPDRQGTLRLGGERGVFGLRANGEEFPLEASINQVKMEDRTTIIAVVRDVSERRAREEQLAQQARELEWRATHDQLSGLLNRRGIDEAIRTYADDVQDVTLIQIDLDRFKHVNDTLGHEAGDAVITAVGDRLREIARPGDNIARMGGDEFLLIRNGKDEEATKTFAEAAIPVLSATVEFNGRPCRFGVSMGAAGGTVDHLRTGELFKRADHALYRAKGEGRGRFRYFSPEMERRLKDRANLAAELEDAIEADELGIAYMPKVSAVDGTIIGLEALVRWNHPERGTLSPATFLPIADELKLTEVLDAQVLKHVMRDREKWLREGYEVPTVSVNVSARRLLEPNLVKIVEDMGIPRGTINFELLESIFLDDTSEMIAWNIDGLRDMGIGIEIDDFGSGHASILGVMKIRPDWVKIDQAIVRQLPLSETGESFVKAIIDMATPFDISVVAEGVESAHQASLLKRLGCTALQGYHIGRAENAARTTRILNRAGQRAAKPA
ncbi:diguanylate cyclase/phosphodiesterase (GGDEF & EAL domains) with PAS/PAC sensor(s) [Rhodovulum sp. P5]|uniref:putative bifunctional diguanylate cyclase/phosphodiesterase n=1 Tax=Rhodovulum sp. P5 TaxID=1564506 RepID=UPI0009C1C294|nr:EAL domain-containing protein [Rhodovulum sp. P5]ARE39869.1 diguanylate cyclase/phosphodiesterase (GGDEF & EAL domains) with PAS/PAC sensor(s) [Rhodovulum sp. P5]